MKDDPTSENPASADQPLSIPDPGTAQPPASLPGPSVGQPPAASRGTDPSGWSQAPAPQSPGPPGAFVDRPAAPPGPALPPGRGAPLQPGPPMSVQAPIRDTTINLMAVVLFAGIGIVAIIVIALIVGAVLKH